MVDTDVTGWREKEMPWEAFPLTCACLHFHKQLKSDLVVSREALLANSVEGCADGNTKGLVILSFNVPLDLRCAAISQSLQHTGYRCFPGPTHFFHMKCLFLDFQWSLNFTSIFGPKEHIKHVLTCVKFPWHWALELFGLHLKSLTNH